MYTVKDIEKAVDVDFDGSWNEFLELVDDDEGVELPSLGLFAKQVDEGGESRPWITFQVGDQFFEKHGDHDSYDGTEWDGGLEEVEPYKETVVFYRSKKR